MNNMTNSKQTKQKKYYLINFKTTFETMYFYWGIYTFTVTLPYFRVRIDFRKWYKQQFK